MRTPLCRASRSNGLLRLGTLVALLLWSAASPAQPRRPNAPASAGASAAHTAASAAPSAEPSALPRTPEERKARLERHKKWSKDWHTRRDQHKKARIKRLRYRLHRALAGKPIPEPVRAELDAHARRMARLYRLKELAVAKEDEGAIEQVEALVRRENARHERWISNTTGSGQRGRTPPPHSSGEAEEAQP